MRTYLLILIIMIFLSSTLFANTPPDLYSITYKKSSPIQSISLKNAKLKLLIYYHGIPKGYIHLITDVNQQFSFNEYKNAGSNLALELVEIEGEYQSNAHCHGTTTLSDLHQILIVCEPMKRK